MGVTWSDLGVLRLSVFNVLSLQWNHVRTCAVTVLQFRFGCALLQRPPKEDCQDIFVLGGFSLQTQSNCFTICRLRLSNSAAQPVLVVEEQKEERPKKRKSKARN